MLRNNADAHISSLGYLCFNQYNPQPFIYLKPEKGTPFLRSLPVQAIIGSTPTPTHPPGTRICQFRMVEMVQRSAARCCLNNYSRRPGIVTNMLENLEWPSLEDRRKLSRLAMFHRVVNRKVIATERDNCIPQEMVIQCCF